MKILFIVSLVLLISGVVLTTTGRKKELVVLGMILSLNGGIGVCLSRIMIFLSLL